MPSGMEVEYDKHEPQEELPQIPDSRQLLQHFARIEPDGEQYRFGK
jgi:hypothetical protein